MTIYHCTKCGETSYGKTESQWHKHFPCKFGDAWSFDITPYHTDNSDGSISHMTTRFADDQRGRDLRCTKCYTPEEVRQHRKQWAREFQNARAGAEK